jgi:hypothetical protein
MNEVTEDWGTFHNDELQNLYCSANIITEVKWMIWAGREARMGGKRNACRVLVLKPEEKRPL